MLTLVRISHNIIGCINGGGQIRPSLGESAKDVLGKVEAIYQSVRCASSNVLAFASVQWKIVSIGKS